MTYGALYLKSNYGTFVYGATGAYEPNAPADPRLYGANNYGVQLYGILNFLFAESSTPVDIAAAAVGYVGSQAIGTTNITISMSASIYLEWLAHGSSDISIETTGNGYIAYIGASTCTVEIASSGTAYIERIGTASSAISIAASGEAWQGALPIHEKVDARLITPNKAARVLNLRVRGRIITNETEARIFQS